MMLSQKLNNIKVAGIFDPFTLECFRRECELILPTPNNWLEMLGEDSLDVLIVELLGDLWKILLMFFGGL